MKSLYTVALVLTLAGCATPSGQSQYKWDEVGQSVIVQFGTVINVREIGITGQNSGAGALIGAGAGAGAGSAIGQGDGKAVAVVGGLIVGAIAGAAAEQALADSTGLEYVITLENGKTITVAQNVNKGDVAVQAGHRVMVQTSGSYQRVLPADTLPTEIKRPRGIKVVD